MVGSLRLGPEDPERSPVHASGNHMHPALHRVQVAVRSESQCDWTMTRMGEFVHTSPRHLTRLFLDHAGTAALQYLRRIRLAVGQAALESGRNVTQVAQIAGFSSDTQLRRTWHQLGMAGRPSDVALLQNH